MKPVRRHNRLRLLLLVGIASALVGACVLNPQPDLPSGASGGPPGGTSSSGGFGIGEGGEAPTAGTSTKGGTGGTTIDEPAGGASDNGGENSGGENSGGENSGGENGSAGESASGGTGGSP
jgi:hypothetical protein